MTTLTPTETKQLATIADAMIPPGDSLPSGAAGGVLTPHLTQVFTARPDLLPATKDALAVLSEAGVTTDLEAARAHAHPWSTIQQVVSAAYFLNPAIRTALGYPGQLARPVAHEPVDPNDPLFEPVRNRGAIYRPTVLATGSEQAQLQSARGDGESRSPDAG